MPLEKREAFILSVLIVICNVYDYFNEQNKKTMIKTGWKLVKKTSESTKFLERTVNWVLLGKRKLGKAQFTSPQKCYKVTKEIMVVDDFDTEAIGGVCMKKRISHSHLTIPSASEERSF